MFVAVRQTWGEDRVFFLEDDGRLRMAAQRLDRHR